MTRAGPSTHMVVFGDSQGVSLLSICRAFRSHKDVPGSSSSVLLERDEETRRGLCATMSHVSAG